MKYAGDMESHEDPKLEAMLTRALERRQDVAVPVDFAARVAASLPPAQKPRRAMQLGRTTAIGAAVVLGVAMFALAPHAAPTFASVAFDFELVAILQLAGIGYLLAVRREV